MSERGFDFVSSAIDQNGNVYVGLIPVGLDDSAHFGPLTYSVTSTLNQLVIVKIDSTGNYRWILGTPYSAVSNNGISSVTDNLGNLYLYGKYVSSVFQIDTLSLHARYFGGDGFLIKISPTGHVIWGRNTVFNAMGALGIDRSNNLYISDVLTDSAVIGTVRLTCVGTARHDVFIAKYDQNGTFIWAYNFGGSADVTPVDMAVSKNGTLYLCGMLYSTTPSTVTFGSTTLSTTGHSPWYTANYLGKFDNNGHPIWARNLPFPFALNALVADDRDQLFATGELDSNTIVGPDTLVNYGGTDAFVAKFDSTGNILWANSAGGSDNESGSDVTIDCRDNVWITGAMGTATWVSFPYTMDFNGATLTATYGFDPTFLAGYDSTGRYLNSFALPSGSDDWINVLVDNNSACYIAGDYAMVQMFFGHDTLPTAPHYAGEFLFVAKYKYDTYGCPFTIPDSATTSTTAEVLTQMDLFPNPAANELNIVSPTPITQLIITDVMGQLIYASKSNSTREQIDVSRFRPGMYLVRINNTEVRRFVKYER